MEGSCGIHTEAEGRRNAGNAGHPMEQSAHPKIRGFLFFFFYFSNDFCSSQMVAGVGYDPGFCSPSISGAVGVVLAWLAIGRPPNYRLKGGGRPP